MSCEEISIELFSFEKMSIGLFYEKNSIELCSCGEICIEFERLIVDELCSLR